MGGTDINEKKVGLWSLSWNPDEDAIQKEHPTSVDIAEVLETEPHLDFESMRKRGLMMTGMALVTIQRMIGVAKVGVQSVQVHSRNSS